MKNQKLNITNSSYNNFFCENAKLTGKQSAMLGYPETNKKIKGVSISIYDFVKNKDKVLENIDNDYNTLKSKYSNILDMLVEWFNKSNDEYSPVSKSNFNLYEIDADDSHKYEFSFDMKGKTKSGKDYKSAGAYSITVSVNGDKVIKKSCSSI